MMQISTSVSPEQLGVVIPGGREIASEDCSKGQGPGRLLSSGLTPPIYPLRASLEVSLVCNLHGITQVISWLRVGSQGSGSGFMGWFLSVTLASIESSGLQKAPWFALPFSAVLEAWPGLKACEF